MFTVQQIQEIARKLIFISKKDSDFKLLESNESLNSEDYIPFIRNNSNRIMTIAQLTSHIKQDNTDLSNIVIKISKLERDIERLNTSVNDFILSTNRKFLAIENNITEIQRRLDSINTKYTFTVSIDIPDATILINGLQQNTIEVTSGTTVNVKVLAEGYESYEESFVVNKDITVYPKLKKLDITFNINATPEDAIIRLNGVVRNSITVPYGTIVNWEVSKTGYITKSGSEIVKINTVLPVELVVAEEGNINFTISMISPLNAVVKINNEQRNTISIKRGTTVTWSVECPHYITQNNSEVVNEDTIKNITLDIEQVTLTIDATPKDAIIEINKEIKNSITVDYNTNVHIKVTKEGYKTYEEDIIITSTQTKTIILEEEDYININPESMEFLYSGGTKNLTITSNTDWTIK